MKEIYDILVNFQKNAYEFYEWEKKDGIEHIRKILSFKVSSNVLYDFINNDLRVDIEFLNKIKNKTQLFNKSLVNIIEYACILCDSNLAVAFEFDKDGKIIGRSKLLFEESDDIILICKNELINNINYKNVKNINTLNDNNFYTRKEKNTISLLIGYLNKIYKEKKYEEINYLYYECFNDNEKNIKIKFEKLKNNVKDLNYSVIDKLIPVITLLKK